MLNHIVIMGRLTRDPELRYTQSGTPVAGFTLAVDRDFTSRESGEKQTDFIDVVAWRQTGEFVSKHFSKGSMAIASGRLQIREWTDREGNKRRSAEIVADNIYFGESKRKSDGTESYRGGTAPSDFGEYDSIPKPGSAFAELDDADGELPF
ncbi:MAG: single-stranded DNA-binding protein [Oscillospiraceae bacterium]|nr:single-stranded DNA-binding protein [Oscillospiraceae bacterium]